MSNDPLDYQHIRTLTEQRLAPLIRLRTRWRWLFFNTIAFFVLNFLTYSTYITVIRFIQDIIGRITRDVSLPDYYDAAPNGLYAITGLWFLALCIYAINLSIAFQHERWMQREMKQEMELERARLLAGVGRQSVENRYAPEVAEKRKHTLALGDDGELIAEDESAVQHE